MNFSIITKYPLWFILFCLALGGIYAFVLYRKKNKLKDVSATIVRLLATLRFLVVSFLAFLLLSPFIKYIDRMVEPPIIVIALDNSESIDLGKDSVALKQAYTQQVQYLSDELGQEFDLSFYTFGAEFTEMDSLLLNQSQTDLSAVLSAVQNRYTNRNVGALVLASDGIYNKGSNPLYTSFAANFPLYTIGLGDTSVLQDAQVSKVVANKIAYFGNQFPISIQLNAQQLAGKSANLSIFHKGKNVFSTEVNYDSNDYFEEFQAVILAEETGLQKFTVQLEMANGEYTGLNNTATAYVDVLDGREKIKMVAKAPHPDVAAIKRSIEKNENYEVEIVLMDDFDGQVKDANLIIYHNLPAKAADLAKMEGMQNVSSLFVVGQQTNISLLNSISTGLTASTVGSEYSDVTAQVSATFPLFTLSKDVGQQIAQFPPLTSPFGKLITTVSSYPVLFQKMGGIVTETPLWFFLQDGGSKNGFVFGEGLWRWPLSDYQNNQTTAHFDELLSKSVQYLSVKSDKSLFRLSTDNELLENQEVVFEAQLYNETYELVNTGEVRIILKNSNGKEYPYTFSKTSSAFYLNAGNLPADEYTYIATAVSGGKELQEKGILTVLPIEIESLELRANHQLLSKLSKQHGGAFFPLSDADQLIEAIKNREDITAVSYSQTKLTDLINNKWIFFLLLGLLSLEWFVRKRSGSY